MVMQRTDFASSGGLCKTDRGLVEVDTDGWSCDCYP